MSITYCTQCNRLLRSARMAQELLSTSATELGTDGKLISERNRDSVLPDTTALTQIVRDRVAPDCDLGDPDRGKGG